MPCPYNVWDYCNILRGGFNGAPDVPDKPHTDQLRPPRLRHHPETNDIGAKMRDAIQPDDGTQALTTVVGRAPAVDAPYVGATSQFLSSVVVAVWRWIAWPTLHLETRTTPFPDVTAHVISPACCTGAGEATYGRGPAYASLARISDSVEPDISPRVLAAVGMAGCPLPLSLGW